MKLLSGHKEFEDVGDLIEESIIFEAAIRQYQSKHPKTEYEVEMYIGGPIFRNGIKTEETETHKLIYSIAVEAKNAEDFLK